MALRILPVGQVTHSSGLVAEQTPQLLAAVQVAVQAASLEVVAVVVVKIFSSVFFPLPSPQAVQVPMASEVVIAERKCPAVC